jgi:hypothetical protein
MTILAFYGIVISTYLANPINYDLLSQPSYPRVHNIPKERGPRLYSTLKSLIVMAVEEQFKFLP